MSKKANKNSRKEIPVMTESEVWEVFKVWQKEDQQNNWRESREIRKEGKYKHYGNDRNSKSESLHL